MPHYSSMDVPIYQEDEVSGKVAEIVEIVMIAGVAVLTDIIADALKIEVDPIILEANCPRSKPGRNCGRLLPLPASSLCRPCLLLRKQS